MSRPLLITDCDEVLLHMLAHFSAWLDEAHALDFSLDGPDFAAAISPRDGRAPLVPAEVWPLLDGFFQTEMYRQTLVPHVREALARIEQVADIVVLTNIGADYHAGRVAQLDAMGIRHRVECNQGGKGKPVAALLEEFAPDVAVFIDDLPVHHDSVSRYAPEVWRLHMVAEPRLAVHIPPAPQAHVRIDDWPNAADWVLERFAAGVEAL